MPDSSFTSLPQCEYLALEGLFQLSETIELVQKYLNPTLQIRGLMMTMYDSRTNLSRQVVEEVRRYFPGKVFSTTMPRNVRLSDHLKFSSPKIGSFSKNEPIWRWEVIFRRLLKTRLFLTFVRLSWRRFAPKSTKISKSTMNEQVFKVCLPVRGR